MVKCSNDYCVNKAVLKTKREECTTPLPAEMALRYLINETSEEENQKIRRFLAHGEWYWKEVYLCQECYDLDSDIGEEHVGTEPIG